MVAEPEAPPSPASPPAGLGPPDTRDLALALARIGGVPDLTLTDAAASLLTAVGDAGRYVFVLVDGLGAAMLEHLAPEGFLQRNSVLSLRAVCPTGTTAALSTLATGLWPAEHGLAGWWTSLPDLGLTATVPTTRSRDGLRDLGGSAATARLFSVPLLANRFTEVVAAYFPRALAGRPYACFLAGGRPARAYDRLDQLLDWLVTSSEAPRLAYVYVPDVDKTAHRYGCASQETRSALGRIESALAEAARRKPASVRLVVSADHGLIDVPIHLPLPREGHVGRLLSAAPSGERRFLFFHVAAGRGDEFAQRFQDGYGATQCLLTVAELADARLLGPEMPEATRRRLGDFAAIPKGAPTILFDGDRPQAASHGGLTPEETVVPLVLA